MSAADPQAERQRVRRRLLSGGALLSLAGLAAPRAAWAGRAPAPAPSGPVPLAESTTRPRSLSFRHTHTGESLEIVYADGAGFDPGALAALNRLLRDHYSGEVGVIDPGLFDLLHSLRSTLGLRAPFEVISGYRSPATNAHLRSSRGGGVASRSLHMDGMAIDIRLPGASLVDLRDAALSLGVGGVGFYPREQFVHVDTGRVRRW